MTSCLHQNKTNIDYSKQWKYEIRIFIGYENNTQERSGTFLA